MLLAQRADLWGIDTVEFRLLQYHILDERNRAFVFAVNMFDRLYEAAYMGSVGSVTQQSSSSYLSSIKTARTEFINAISPNYVDRQHVKQPEQVSKADAKKMDYMKLFGRGKLNIKDLLTNKYALDTALMRRDKRDEK